MFHPFTAWLVVSGTILVSAHPGLTLVLPRTCLGPGGAGQGRGGQKTVNDLPVGRSVDEVLRLVKAFQVRG